MKRNQWNTAMHWLSFESASIAMSWKWQLITYYTGQPMTSLRQDIEGKKNRQSNEKYLCALRLLGWFRQKRLYLRSHQPRHLLKHTCSSRWIIRVRYRKMVGVRVSVMQNQRLQPYFAGRDAWKSRDTELRNHRYCYQPKLVRFCLSGTGVFNDSESGSYSSTPHWILYSRLRHPLAGNYLKPHHYGWGRA